MDPAIGAACQFIEPNQKSKKNESVIWTRYDRFIHGLTRHFALSFMYVIMWSVWNAPSLLGKKHFSLWRGRRFFYLISISICTDKMQTSSVVDKLFKFYISILILSREQWIPTYKHDIMYVPRMIFLSKKEARRFRDTYCRLCQRGSCVTTTRATPQLDNTAVPFSGDETVRTEFRLILHAAHRYQSVFKCENQWRKKNQVCT